VEAPLEARYAATVLQWVNSTLVVVDDARLTMLDTLVATGEKGDFESMYLDTCCLIWTTRRGLAASGIVRCMLAVGIEPEQALDVLVEIGGSARVTSCGSSLADTEPGMGETDREVMSLALPDSGSMHSAGKIVLVATDSLKDQKILDLENKRQAA
jgi:hypothetical protein